jgi:hypothetical protein
VEKPPSSTNGPQSVSGLERVFRICESFAAAWREGQRPQIDNYLGKITESELLLLLPELLSVELAERRRRGEHPKLEDYQAMFPAHCDLVAVAFSSSQRQGSGEVEAGTVVGDFRIEKRIGAGGMGIVFLARQISLNRLVALKVLGAALAGQSDIARFQREAQAIAKLNHPGIAGIHFVGQDRHICYIAMEYIDGMSLRELMKRLSSPNNDRSIDDILQATCEEGQAPEIRYDGPTLTYATESSASENPTPQMSQWQCSSVSQVRTRTSDAAARSFGMRPSVSRMPMNAGSFIGTSSPRTSCWTVRASRI